MMKGEGRIPLMRGEGWMPLSRGESDCNCKISVFLGKKKTYRVDAEDLRVAGLFGCWGETLGDDGEKSMQWTAELLFHIHVHPTSGDNDFVPRHFFSNKDYKKKIHRTVGLCSVWRTIRIFRDQRVYTRVDRFRLLANYVQ